MREIGSEFWDIPVGGNTHFKMLNETWWFLSGRIALHYTIKDILSKQKLKKVALPSWCCESMIQPFAFYNIEICFYSVTLEEGKGLKFDFTEIEQCDAILLMDYFGYKTTPTIEFDGIVIYDCTHSVLSYNDNRADYVFGSLRKWAGFYSGGFAYCKNGFTIPPITGVHSEFCTTRKSAMEKKGKYISGETLDKGYLNQFAYAENLLESASANGDLFVADSRDIEMVRKIDVGRIKKQRIRNAAIIHEQLGEFTLFTDISNESCPMFVPAIFPADKRNRMREYLISKQIYLPIHWPISKLHDLDVETKEIYQCALSIVCDQRYDEEHMMKICKTIKSFL